MMAHHDASIELLNQRVHGDRAGFRNLSNAEARTRKVLCAYVEGAECDMCVLLVRQKTVWLLWARRPSLHGRTWAGQRSVDSDDQRILQLALLVHHALPRRSVQCKSIGASVPDD